MQFKLLSDLQILAESIGKFSRLFSGILNSLTVAEDEELESLLSPDTQDVNTCAL